MQYYLVGGAVRDELLGRIPRERDWLVVGATPEALLRQGFRRVGKDFPVFLHPHTGEEYALPRSVDGSVSADLQQRDLTINALARAPDGGLLDPCGGLADLHAGILRHTGPAFKTDPIRILRLARFAAQLPTFQLASETALFVSEWIAQGALQQIVIERVWRECEKALMAPAPERFFDLLQQWQAWAVIAPGLAASWPEGRAALQAVVLQQGDLEQRVASLFLGDGFGAWASQAALTTGQQLGVPTALTQFAALSVRYRRVIQAGPTGRRPAHALALLERLDALRRTSRWLKLLALWQMVGILSPAIGAAWTQAVARVKQVPAEPLLAQGLRGEALGRALCGARQAVLTLPN